MLWVDNNPLYWQLLEKYPKAAKKLRVRKKWLKRSKKEERIRYKRRPKYLRNLEEQLWREAIGVGSIYAPFIPLQTTSGK